MTYLRAVALLVCCACAKEGTVNGPCNPDGTCRGSLICVPMENDAIGIVYRCVPKSNTEKGPTK